MNGAQAGPREAQESQHYGGESTKEKTAVRATGTSAPHGNHGGRWTSGQRSFMNLFSSWHLWPLGPVSLSVFLVFCSLLGSVLFFSSPQCGAAVPCSDLGISSPPFPGLLPCVEGCHATVPGTQHPQHPPSCTPSSPRPRSGAWIPRLLSSKPKLLPGFHISRRDRPSHIVAQPRILGAGKPIALPSHLQVSGLSSSLYGSLQPEVSMGWGLLRAPWLHPC